MLEKNVQYLKGIGPKKARILLEETGITTIEDLLYYAPRRYLDRSNLKQIKDCFVNELVTIGGRITRVFLAGKNKKFLEVVIDDGSESISGIFFRGIPYFRKTFVPGDFVFFSGKIDFFRKKQIVHPDYDFIDEDSSVKSINTGRVIPLYRSTEKLKSSGFDSRGFRRILRHIIDNYLMYIDDDPLDREMRERHGLIGFKDALFSMHFPETVEDAERARKRLAFNELYFLQAYLGLTRNIIKHTSADLQPSFNRASLDSFIEHLPFTLTDGQKQCIDDISADMQKAVPMNRLLQGDVGSGKTVVAMAAALICVSQEKQCSLMAPTEILAAQHFNTFSKYLPGNIRTALLTGSTTAADKRSLLTDTASGIIDILIGTHALLNADVAFRNPGLAIIDEQHRFGVTQRGRLRAKGEDLNLLVMTATPIPRSLALTLYGDLDLSSLREKPASRPPITTMAFPESRVQGIYNSMDKYISQGRQIYVVLPLIEESEKLDIQSALQIYEKLKRSVFPDKNVDILHGRMSGAEKDQAMSRFQKGETDILVSTTVIEVGIDVPNANVMVIYHAERFGLSQLHQLRGRIGRGEHRSFCILVYPDDIGDESMRRINTLVAINDGFKIAEEDLQLRGSGEIIGLRQHGHASGFEFTDIAVDLDIITAARNEALKIVEDIDPVHVATVDEYFENPGNKLFKGIRKRRVLELLS